MFRVFIVDDEPSVLEGLKIMVPWKTLEFELCGEATNGQDALEQIQHLRPHLIITDIRMPRLSGLQLLHEARKLELDTEFIILSGYSDFSYAQEAMRYQVFDYLLKPLDIQELLEALHITKAKLDQKFLSCYGFSQADIEVFRTGRQLAREKQQEDVAGTWHEAFEEKLEAAVRLMNEQEATALADSMFECFLTEKIGLVEAQTLVHSYVYQILCIAYERGITLDRILPTKQSRALSFEKLKAYFSGILLQAIRLMLESRRVNAHHSLYEVKQYIEKNFDRELGVASLAERVFLDAGYLGDAFNRQFGFGIIEYQHRLRITRAAELIETTGLTLSEIAAAVGYKNYNNFFTHFIRVTHKKPTEYIRGEKVPDR